MGRKDYSGKLVKREKKLVKNLTLREIIDILSIYNFYDS